MNLIVNPQELIAAAGDLQNIETMVSEANAFAALPTTMIAAPGADEVSAAISALFTTHGAQYQELAAQARAFQHQFIQTLTGSAGVYQGAEHDNTNSLRGGVTQGENASSLGKYLGFAGSGGDPAPIPPTATNPVLVVGGTGYPTVSPRLLTQIGAYYFPGNPDVYAVQTPEQFWPLTPQLGSLTMNQSMKLGQQNLNNVLMEQLAMGHSPTVWGTSQGATVETLEMRYLMAHGSPGADQIKFVLTGDPNNPNGGALERFNGLNIPGLGLHFNGPTPPDTPYTTSIYTNQYDAVADFPRYPLNVVSDANALAGFAWGAHDYVDNPYEVTSAHQLPTSPGYTGHTSYYMTLTQNLPLLSPIRDIPQPFGNAIADLLQPDLRVIVDMGYGSGEYANLPTPATLVEFPNVPNIAHDLALGTVQGPRQALFDLGLPGGQEMYGHYPYSPVVDPQLNYPTPQTPVTELSLLTGLEGSPWQALAALQGMVR